MSGNDPRCTQNFQESLNNDEDMSATRTTISQGGRLKWTEKMCVDLTTCKRKAEELYLSENCPRKENGRKEGKVNLTIHFWNNMGYQHLNRTAQNLRDKLAHIEKTTKATASQTTKEIQQQRNRRNQQQDRSAEIEEGNILQNSIQEENESITTDQHANYARNTQAENVNTEDACDEKYLKLLARTTGIYNKIVQQTGDWSYRDESTFFKKKPHKNQFSNLQNVAKNLIKANPVEDPERFLWEYNCAIYATVITYKKGTKEKKSNATQRTNNDSRHRWLVKLESKMTVLRKEISQLSEEIRRTKYNIKMTKRLWKNRITVD